MSRGGSVKRKVKKLFEIGNWREGSVKGTKNVGGVLELTLYILEVSGKYNMFLELSRF